MRGTARIEPGASTGSSSHRHRVNVDDGRQQGTAITTTTTTTQIRQTVAFARGLTSSPRTTAAGVHGT